ncbi:uncharacterized protein LOC124158984 [Ischnura elegans]|uniref:uncharacterized protein LOC124158984 n=1 Tax=Ischnura elegans TaxID=197161 RepID=UPI001ED8B8A7|nr:uncharacterized protein LOC124158984 [Ischnura elegans]
MESPVAGRRRERLKKGDNYLESEYGLNVLEKKKAMKKGKSVIVKTSARTRMKPSCGTGDHLHHHQHRHHRQHHNVRCGGESTSPDAVYMEKSARERGISEKDGKRSDERDNTKSNFRFPIDFDVKLNDEWEDFGSEDSCSDRGGGYQTTRVREGSDTARTFSVEERVLTPKSINQIRRDFSSGDGPLQRDLAQSYADIHIPVGLVDDPLPPSVPLFGLKSSRSSGLSASRPHTARCQSARESSGSPYARAVRSTSAREIPVQSLARAMSSRSSSRPLTGKSRVEFRLSKSTERSPSARSSHSGRTSMRSRSSEISPYRVVRRSASPSSSGSSSPASPRRTSSSHRHNGLPLPLYPSVMNNATGVRRTWSYASDAPGYWEPLGGSNDTNLGNVAVWAVTDPPRPPKGIYWKKVTPPASPPPQPAPATKADPVAPKQEEEAEEEKEDGEACLEATEEEAGEDVVDAPSAGAVVPELVPSSDPVPPLVQVVRQVVVVPETAQKAYPGFCDSSEALKTLKSKKSRSEEGVGAKRRQQDEGQKRHKAKVPKEGVAGQDKKGKVVEGGKKGGIITPSAWKTGLKWAKKELGPKTSRSVCSNMNCGKLSEASEKSVDKKLNDIKKFVNETENKISDHKLLHVNESDTGITAPEVDTHPKEAVNNKKTFENEPESIHKKSKLNDAKLLSSISDKDMLTHVISKKDSIQTDKRNYAKNKIGDSVSPVKNFSHMEKLMKTGKDSMHQTKSTHDLNNAFIEDECHKIPLKSNSLTNFSGQTSYKSLEDVPLKCPQPSKSYDPKKIKEYIRLQKQLRHRKSLEEKERKKLEEERKRAKLMDLRSRSKELVEESVKRRSAILKNQIEDLQRNSYQVGDIMQSAPLSGISERSAVPSESIRSERSGVPSSGPGEPKNTSLCPSDESGYPRVISKPVSDVALQTGDSLVELEPENTKIELALPCDKAVSSLKLPSSMPVDQNLSTNSANLGSGVREDSVGKNPDHPSGSGPIRVVLDKGVCGTIEREVKKLTQNLLMLEKHKMIGVLPDNPLSDPSPKQVNEFEVSEKQTANLKNTNSSVWEAEQQMSARNQIPTNVFQPNNLVPTTPLNSGNQSLTQKVHLSTEKTSNTKSSVNIIAFRNGNIMSSSARNSTSILVPKSNEAALDNGAIHKDNSTFNRIAIRLSSSSMMSEGPLLDEDLNQSHWKDTQLNNLCGTSHSKITQENKGKEEPFWLQNLSTDSRPFNFISAVKMKLNKFLEEQNEKNVSESVSKIAKSLRPELSKAENLIAPNDKLIPKLSEAAAEQEVKYDSDFEVSAHSSVEPNQETENDVADSSDLDTATEDILPTDEVPKAPVSPPKQIEILKIPDDSLSEDASEAKSSKSTTSIKYNYAHPDFELVVPKISLTQSISSHTSTSLESSKSQSVRSLLSNISGFKLPDDSGNESTASLPKEVSASKVNAKRPNVESRSKKLLTSKPGVSPERIAHSPESLGDSSTTTMRSGPELDSPPRTFSITSNNSSEGYRIFSRDHASSHHGSLQPLELQMPVSPKLKLPKERKRASQELKRSTPKPVLENAVIESTKKIIDNHAEKLAEMERKAFEHRVEMERAFEKERLKLELALAEAKRTVFDSKLEASKFISDAAVELIKSQAEATKANAEATKHLSEAKVMDSLKLETISAQTASAAAVAAVQAAMRQLKSIERVKYSTRKSEVSASSEQSDTSSVLSVPGDDEVIANGNRDQLSNADKVSTPQINVEDDESNSSIAEDLNDRGNSEELTEKVEDDTKKEVEYYPEDSSVQSISEKISDQEYSSKFEDTASDIEVQAKPESKQGDYVAIKNIVSKKMENKEIKKGAVKRKFEPVPDKHQLNSTSDIQGFLEAPDINDESSNSGKDSFTNFSLSMFQQLMKEEEMRAQHQQALLKLREETLIDKTKAEMILLELKKKHCREKGLEDIVSSIRKKQRGMLIKLKLERDEIQRLRKSHKTASHERRMMLIQQQHIIKMRMSTKEIMNKLHTKKLPPTPKAIRSMGLMRSALDSSRSSVEVKTEESALGSRTHSIVGPEELPSLDGTQSDASIPTELAHSSHASASDSEGQKNVKGETHALEKQVSHGLNDMERNKKFLSEREKNLIHRRQAVEELLLWRKRLELEEERVRALESKAMVSKSPTLKSQKSYPEDQDFVGQKADRSTSPLQLDGELIMREDAATSMADFSSAHSESVLEDVPNQSEKSSVSMSNGIQSDFNNLEQSISENVPSQTSESSVKTQISLEKQSKEEVSVREMVDSEKNLKSKDSKSPTTTKDLATGKDESKASSLDIAIKSPLTPYFVARQKRRHSSGSDDSIVLSQNETASEQSDIESKICALQEQLRRRKMEADLLKKQQKRIHRERLKAKEQSLIKQIQAYDLYIQRAHKELEQEYESPSASLVKPQIKHRRNWKKKVEEAKEVSVETPDKIQTVDSTSEVLERVSLAASAVEQSVKSPSTEDHVETASLPETQSGESKVNSSVVSEENLNGSQAQESLNDGRTRDNSMSSLSEVIEEMPALEEDFPVSENSPQSLSRGSSLETTIESPTKHQAELLNAFEVEEKEEVDKESEKVLAENNVSRPLSASASIEQNVVSKLAEDNKSDKYDDDTFEHMSDTGVEAKETSVENHSDDAHSSICPASEEIVEELSQVSGHELSDQTAAEESDVHDVTAEKSVASEDIESPKGLPADENRSKDVVIETLIVSDPQQISEEPASLPPRDLDETSIQEVGLNETFVIPKKGASHEKEADKISEGIFQNLFEESVVEAEILRNKNSTSTLELVECNEKVTELSPLFKVEEFEEIEEFRFQPTGDKGEVNIVSVRIAESKSLTVTETEASGKLESMKKIPKENLICDLLIQFLLRDAIIEMMDVNERRKSLGLTFKGLPEQSLSEKEPDDKVIGSKGSSEVMKRVQQIMLESSISQVSPREKSRPQDLMITTYDVLSPENSACNSPVMGHSGMESVFVGVEKVASKPCDNQQGGKPIQFLQVEHGGNLGASSGNGGSGSADNETFSQDWFEEDFGLNSSLREVEEIQLQQLQIEREIEQLQLAQAKEQQQRGYPYNFYIREIPNKPPPPYTPPEETPRLSAAIGSPISPLGTPRDPSPRAAVPTEQEEVANLLESAIGEFYDCWQKKESLDSVEMPKCFQCTMPQDEEESVCDRSVEEQIQKKSRWSYLQFLFDLSRQLVDEALDNVEAEKWVSVPTKFGSRKLKPTLPLPDKKCFVDEVTKQGLIILGYLPRETRDNVMFSWTLKKRDRIDEILMREVQEEDRYWTNFDEEEKYLKEQLAESLFELLLVDTTKAVASAFKGRAQRMSSAKS